jgi:6-oxo-cyclohex-1-ene-carbonyl-CoA hydrolase
MAMDWLPRDNKLKDHQLVGDEFFGTEPPCTMYEKKPLVNPRAGETVDGLYTAWITLNNPAQYNSYTTQMVKGVIAGMKKASADRSVVAIIFTAAGDRAFCTGGNTKEYAEYYTLRPREYRDYINLFSGMVDSILDAGAPVICRVNGMRVAGGQEIGQACDLAIASDLALFGQAGTGVGSTPDGGSTDFLPWQLPTTELAIWNCVSNELWSAYKMHRLGFITDVMPVKKLNGEWIRNPLVITDKYIEDGKIVYGEPKTGDEAKKAKEIIKTSETDFSLLDRRVNEVVWTLTNLMPMCLMKSIETIRWKKKFFWDGNKISAKYWLGANMNMEAYLGFNAFNTEDMTGQRRIDFVKYRQLIAQGHSFDDDLAEQVMPKPKK